jgi:hypothetical protein
VVAVKLLLVFAGELVVVVVVGFLLLDFAFNESIFEIFAGNDESELIEEFVKLSDDDLVVVSFGLK